MFLLIESTDPCRDKQCGFGARCVVSSDGRYATCECPTHCPNYGDHTKSRPVCGTNGQDYSDLCTLRMDACSTNGNITVKYDGKCGKNIHYYEILYKNNAKLFQLFY